MADVTKTVEVIFSAVDKTSSLDDAKTRIQNLDSAAEKAKSGGVATLGGKVQDLSDAAQSATGKINSAASAIADVDKVSNSAAKSSSILTGAVSETATELNISATQAAVLETALAGFSAGAVLATAAFAALAAAGLAAGGEAFNFETKIKNLTGSAKDAKDQFDFIRDASVRLGTSFEVSTKSFVDFLKEVSNEEFTRGDVQASYLGFARIFKSLGEDISKAEKPAKDFLKAIEDGNITFEELEKLGDKIPGLFDRFAEALGMTREEFVDFAKENKIGNEEINKLQEYLVNGFKFDSLTPVSDAFRDLWSSVKLLADSLGFDGVFVAAITVASKVIQALTLSVVGAQESTVALGKSIANIVYSIKNLDWEGYVTRQNEIVNSFSANVKTARDKLLNLGDGATALDAGRDAARKLAASLKDSREELAGVELKAGELGKAFKTLDLDPKKFQDQTGVILAALNTILRDPNADRAGILSGLASTLTKLSDGPDTRGSLQYLRALFLDAFDAGKIGATDLADALKLIELKAQGAITETSNLKLAQKGASDEAKKLAEEQKRVAKQIQETQDKADKYALKLADLASNEKIKAFEATIKLNIANVEANAKIAQSIIDGIAKTYEADVGLIKTVLDQVENGYSNADRARLKIVQDANDRINDLAKSQKALIQAQTDFLNAKTAALLGGTPLITVQGDGLQPHLEAFMWEILRAIQVRVAKDGLDLLLGTQI